MCGIIGQISTKRLNLEQEHFETSMALMPHRGPDAKSTWINDAGTVCLGHVRLSIQDPRPEGTQPMHLSQIGGDISVVFNGEIYNFIELKKELMNLSYAFTTQTDTEVILAAYAAWGESCVERFNGMFAICLYDATKNTVFFWRDRMGEKPLYYHVSMDGVLSFASEMNVLLHLASIPKPRVVDLDAVLIENYMAFGYIPGEMPLQARGLTSILKLMPATQMKVDLTKQNFRPTTTVYWVDKPIQSVDEDMSLEHAALKTKEIIDSSLDMRLRADVPLGVFLSGGLDSSAVVSWLAPRVPGRLKTFSVRYDVEQFGLGFDESMYARQVATAFNTEHYEFTMTPKHFIDYLEKYVHLMGEPVTEAAAVSLHYVSELAKDHVTVVLSGEGSDEIFAGYELYQRMMFIEKFRKICTPLVTSLLNKVAKAILPNGHKLQKYIAWAALPFEERYKGISISNPIYRDNTYLKTFKERLANQNDKEQHPTSRFMKKIMMDTRGDSLLNRMLRFDRKTWLVDDLLIKADRMSMGSSLELRVPFLDHRLIEWSNQIPNKFKIKDGDPKYILKQIVPDLPQNIINREKTGFPTPLAQMFKEGELSRYLLDNFNAADCPLWEIFQKDSVFAIIRQHRSGDVDHHAYLWQLLVLSLWLKSYCQPIQH